MKTGLDRVRCKSLLDGRLIAQLNYSLTKNLASRKVICFVQVGQVASMIPGVTEIRVPQLGHGP
jgi:hypothetical protein